MGKFEDLKKKFNGKFEDLKMTLNWHYYNSVIGLTGKTPAELGELMKEGKIKLPTKSFSILLAFTSLIVSLLIVLQAFKPVIETLGWGVISIPLIMGAIGVGFILLGIFLKLLNVSIQLAISGAILLLGAIIIAIILVIGSPNLVAILRSVWIIRTAETGVKAFQAISGTQFAWIVFGICEVFVLFCFLIAKPKALGCFAIPIILFIIFFLILKPLLALSGLSKFASIERKVNVQYTVPVKEIPATGGIRIEYGSEETNYKPATLLAAQPYIYYYSIQNVYEEPIQIKIEPWIEAKYMYAYVRFKVESSQVSQLNKPPYTEARTFKPKEIYQDQIFYDPNKMIVEGSGECPYLAGEIANNHNLNLEEVPCGFDKKCENPRTICVKTGSFLCDCLGWTPLTCGGAKAYMGMSIWHTGFLRANGTLFYKKEFFEPIANKKNVQGPLAITPIFFPNPWIEEFYKEYVENVKLSLEIENSGPGDITITSAKAFPSGVLITTTVRGFSEDLNEYVEATVEEKIGIDLIECKDIKNVEIPSGVRKYEEFCTFSKPKLETRIVNLVTNKTVYNTSIDIKNISKYCKGEEEFENLEPQLRRYMKSVMKNVEKTGLCEFLEKTREEKTKKEEEKETFTEIWKKKIEDSLKQVEVIIEINYERKFEDSSSSIEIYTNTEECLIYSCCHGSKNIICEAWSDKEREEKCAKIS